MDERSAEDAVLRLTNLYRSAAQLSTHTPSDDSPAPFPHARLVDAVAELHRAATAAGLVDDIAREGLEPIESVLDALRHVDVTIQFPPRQEKVRHTTRTFQCS